MVRLETVTTLMIETLIVAFTFQYGQIRNNSCSMECYKLFKIYIPVWLDQKLMKLQSCIKLIDYLHSSMVRLETLERAEAGDIFEIFTFQYGQIRNLQVYQEQHLFDENLHSSMVRLETILSNQLLILRPPIYIPVWLDQKLNLAIAQLKVIQHLHSSMVRLETPSVHDAEPMPTIFTFQYGQIRNFGF